MDSSVANGNECGGEPGKLKMARGGSLVIRMEACQKSTEIEAILHQGRSGTRVQAEW